MKLFFSLALFSLLSSFCSAISIDGNEFELDTNRGPQSFQQPQRRKTGYTYQDDVALEVQGAMTDYVFPLGVHLGLLGETQTKIVDYPGVGTLVQVDLEEAEGYLDSPVLRIICDGHHSHSDCSSLQALMGTRFTMLLDQDGIPLELILPSGKRIDMENYWNQDTNANNVTMTPALWDNQLFQFLPNHEVQPGDWWDVNITGLAAIGGVFLGESTLKGYTSYDGFDCAVFRFGGALHLDISQLAQLFGYDIDNTPFPNHMDDASVTKTILWDNENGIARLAQVNVSTTFTIQSDDASTVHIPTQVFLQWETDIIGSPDDATRQQQQQAEVSSQESYALLSASLASHGRTPGSTRGWLPPMKTLLSLFGVLAVTGLAVLKWNHHSQYSQYQQLA